MIILSTFDWKLSKNSILESDVLVNMVLKIRVAEYAVKVLTSRGTGGLSSRTLLDGVS